VIAAAQIRITRLWKENSSYALAAGSGVIAPAVGLLTAPILTRIYSPAEFGVLGSFAAILAAALSVTNLRYDAAVPLPQKDEEAYSLAMAAIRIGVIASFVITLLFIGFAPFIFDAAMTKALMANVWWLPIALMLAAATQVLTQFAVRRAAFGELAAARLVQGVTGPAVQIGAGVAGLGVVGLLIGQAASQSGGLIRLWKSARKLRRTFAGVPPACQLLKRYERFPRVSLLPAFINALGLQLPILIVARTHGVAAAGLILLIVRVIGTPLAILGLAGGQTLVADAARLRREGRSALAIVNRTIGRQFVLTSPILLATPFLPWLFPRIFGAQWAEAGRYALVFVPALVGISVLGPTFAIFDIYERQGTQFMREIVRVVTIIVAVIIARRVSGGTMAIIGALSVAMILNLVFGYWLVRRVANETVEQPAVA
jgi:O-antigen/teichoic acid export membrane protein